MTYTKQTWVENSTQATAEKLNHIESGIEEANLPIGVKAANKPAVGAENTVTIGTAGICRVVNSVLVGNGVNKEFIIKHGLKTFIVGVDIWKEKGTSGSETNPNKWVIVKETATSESEEEVKIVFETAPKAKEAFWVQVTG